MRLYVRLTDCKEIVWHTVHSTYKQMLVHKRQEVVAHAWRYSRKCTVHSHLQYRQHSLFMNDVRSTQGTIVLYLAYKY